MPPGDDVLSVDQDLRSHGRAKPAWSPFSFSHLRELSDRWGKDEGRSSAPRAATPSGVVSPSRRGATASRPVRIAIIQSKSRHRRDQPAQHGRNM